MPPVHSVSYGNDEAQQTGRAYMDSVNTAFAKLSATGVTILFAAGDQGVWGREGVGTKYHPDFPAGSPYVTAVSTCVEIAETLVKLNAIEQTPEWKHSRVDGVSPSYRCCYGDDVASMA